MKTHATNSDGDYRHTHRNIGTITRITKNTLEYANDSLNI